VFQLCPSQHLHEHFDSAGRFDRLIAVVTDGCSTTDPDDDHTRFLADWDFRVEQEREQFRLYEHRRAEFELQATTITAGALTMAALLIAAQDKLARLGDIVEYGVSGTILALVYSISTFGVQAAAGRDGDLVGVI
jgi:hypothetical protein